MEPIKERKIKQKDGRDNLSFLPDIEEPSQSRQPDQRDQRDRTLLPGVTVEEKDYTPRKKATAEDRIPQQPTVQMTPTPTRLTEPEAEPDLTKLRAKRQHKKDDSELVLGILNMLMVRVENNTNNINKYVLKKFADDDHSKPHHSRLDRVVVEVRVIFMKIIDVDTLEQQFRAEMFIQARWLEPNLNDSSESELERFQGENSWIPNLIVNNLVGDPEQDETWYLAKRYPDFLSPTVTMRRKLTATFSEILELNDFPIDVQELTVQISSRRSEKEVQLIQDNYRISTVNVDNFLDQDQFVLYPHVFTTTGHVTSDLIATRDRQSAIYFSCSVKRKAAYFFWNIFLVMFIISTLCFTAFAIVPTNPHNRLAVNIVILLTAIAFKFVINKSIPQIPYLTYLDFYVLGCVVLIAAHSCENAIITAFPGNGQRQLDYYLLYILATGHVVFNLAFMVFMFVMNIRANILIRERNRNYIIQREVIDGKRKGMAVQVDEDMYAPIV